MVSARRTAAFFDLDRTLLRGVSGPVISRALKAAGLVPDRDVPGEALLYRWFDLFGENRPAMEVTRRAVQLTKGWPAARAREAGAAAVPGLEAMVQPYAVPIMAEHQSQGRPVVLATTTPYDVVAPFADRLGFDDVVATRYGEDDEGCYDGTLRGEFVWGPGKWRAVARWARDHDVDLAGSYAYSDSYFDLPLLSGVGHPHAVNPDARLALVAAVRRWPVLHLDVPVGVPKVLGVEPQQVAMALARPELLPFVRFTVSGIEALPADGPAIVCANHRSYFDPLALGFALARAGRSVRFLGKKEVFDAPVVGQLAGAIGGIRVERGSGSDAPLEAAVKALAAGEVVVILPEGTIPRGPAFFDPVLTGRWGAARLAAATGAPVYPVGLWGTEQVWPRSAKVPRVWNVVDPPTVTVRMGGPVKVVGRSPAADTKRIMAAIAALLPPEARRRRNPTAAELAATYPSGRLPPEGDEDHERLRRPGRD